MSWDKDKKNKFTTYLNACMNNEIKMYLRNKHEDNITFSDLFNPPNNEEIEVERYIEDLQANYDTIDDRITVENTMEKLSYRESSVIKMYYMEGYNQNEIGEIIGLTQSNVSRVKTQALGKMHKIIQH